MDQEGQGRYPKLVNWSSLVCLLFFSTTGHAFASDLNDSFDVQVILKSVVGLVKSLKNGPDKYILFGEMGELQAKAGLIGDAQQSLAGIPDGFQNDYQKFRLKKEIALANARAGRIADAIQVASTIPIFAREHVFGEIALKKAKSGDVTGAFEILQNIGKGTNAKENALKAIGEIQAKSGNLRGGIHTALQTADRYPHALWGIIEDQVKTGHQKEVLSEIHRIPLDISRQYALWGVVSAHLANKDIAGAIEVAKIIPDGHASANAWKDITIVQIEAGSIQASLINLKRALDGASATHNRFAKSDVLWRVAACQAKAGDVAGALQTVGLIDEDSHRNHALREIAANQSKAGDVEGALQTASRFKTDFSSPHPYVFILQDLARSGKVKRAFQIAASLKTELKESPFEAIAFGQAESGDIEGALQTLGKIQWSGDKASYNRALVFEYLSYILVQSGHLDEATRIASMVDQSWRPGALADISLAFVKEGKVGRALEIISSIKQEQPLADLLQNIAHAQVAQGDSPGVLKWSKKITSPFVKSKVLLGAVRGILDVPSSHAIVKKAG